MPDALAAEKSARHSAILTSSTSQQHVVGKEITVPGAPKSLRRHYGDVVTTVESIV